MIFIIEYYSATLNATVTVEAADEFEAIEKARAMAHRQSVIDDTLKIVHDDFQWMFDQLNKSIIEDFKKSK